MLTTADIESDSWIYVPTILPETNARSVKCEYCGAIQDAYTKTSAPYI